MCWKEAAEASRALMAALPLLAAGKRVIVATVEETAESPGDDLGIVRQLAWHGISAEPMRIPAEGRPVHEELECAATRYGADLLVMGAYGHSRARQLVFGGCTQHFLDGAELPVLLMH